VMQSWAAKKEVESCLDVYDWESYHPFAPRTIMLGTIVPKNVYGYDLLLVGRVKGVINASIMRNFLVVLSRHKLINDMLSTKLTGMNLFM